MADPLQNMMRPGFPKETYDGKSYRTVIEYVGLQEDLISASPRIGSVWGDYQGTVLSDELDRFEGSDYGILTVICERNFEPLGEGRSGLGTKQENETTYELDWLDVSRSMYEHPQFAIDQGGANALTAEDVHAIKEWEKMDKVEYKKEYRYYIDNSQIETEELSGNAKLFARSIELGIEYWVEKVPVARRSDTYVNGPPPAGTAGLKEDPVGFLSLPAGYQWIRSADRAIKAGKQNTWQNETEWLGAKKVLVDAARIYWSAP